MTEDDSYVSIAEKIYKKMTGMPRRDYFKKGGGGNCSATGGPSHVSTMDSGEQAYQRNAQANNYQCLKRQYVACNFRGSATQFFLCRS